MYKFNEGAFKDFGITEAYWAGFIAADGCVTKNGSKYRLSLVLSNKDRFHLVKFKKFLKSNHKIHNRVTDKGHKYCQIHIYSDKIISDLNEKYNITPRKSLTLSPPNITDNRLIDAFIVGYIDGDGSINITKRNNRYPHLQISILGTRQILSFISQRLSEVLGRDKPFNVYEKTKNGIHHIAINTKQAREIFKYFEKIDVPKMNRKWGSPYKDHCYNWKPNYFTKEKRLNRFN